ncbi:MAG: hypothetical protein GTO29_04180 [Candidatus Latescibacteria bacterium]|nr:hypothetical protein [Candidatus Latescibacterota bacterium]NIO55275.1 hypothetical protein [Candidatus Latescibacterota bacterium]
MDSAIRAVAVLCFGELGKVVNIQSHQFLPWILDKNVVLELDALSEVEKTFFIELLLLWIHHHRLQEPDREKLKHVILIEEAHHILLRKKQEIEGTETVVDTLIREIRELGEGIVVIDQHPSLVSRPALGNTYTTICLNLKEATDVRAASDAMLLKDDQREYLGHLPVGQGIVKLQDRWTRPFLVDFPR